MRELAAPPPIEAEANLSPAQWGILAFLLSEVAFFSTLIVAYVTFLGRDGVGPTPREALSLSLVLSTTTCLLASSFTIHLATHALAQGKRGAFLLWWGATILLGGLFLLGTAYEWYELITHHQLTIGRNLFGTTFYTLVGFHGLHVSAGLVTMLIVWGLMARRALTAAAHGGVEMVAWYWHFVDAVWVVVFLVVYVVGR